MSLLHVNQIKGFLLRSYKGLIDLRDVANLQEADREKVLLSRALAAFAVAQLAGLEPEHAAAAVTDGAGDNGVDALHYDRATRTLYIVQAKWFGDGHGSLDVADASKLVQGFRDLVDQRAESFNDKAKAKMAMVEEAMLADKASYVLVPIYTGQEPLAPEPERVLDECLSKFNDWKDEAAEDLLSLRVLRQSDIYGMVVQGTRGEPIALEVLLHEYGQVEGPFAVYGQVEAEHVAGWWSKHYPQLVEPNIRRFLGTDMDVNSGLLNTLLNEPEHFWHYNNGLTVVCQRIERRLSAGAGKTVFIVCHGAAIVNGAQTAGSIATAHGKNPAAVQRARVQARFISVDGPEGQALSAAITKATNTQNQITRRDFVALDPEQERLRMELGLEGVLYHFKSGEAVVRNATTFDLEEATVALACASADLAMSTQAKREIGRLWDNTEKAPYKALFNAGTSSTLLWRHVRVMRMIDSALQTLQSTLDGRDRGFAVHGNRFIAHHVYRSLPLSSGVGAPYPIPSEQDVFALVARAVAATAEAANRLYPGAYLAQLFKNQAKLAAVSREMPSP
ncbi:AIPR family protein [Neoroseomonas soli]|uniref:AIPR family protein n=1 Tax=Neoroseomonas soli TaxID=1081025 RepID=A0A9X9WS27_9PROT|nr:AIPR family protein [Neoroseomonas soli]MBR0669956.1 AIPR family protein [Neoroseomonas soli]